VPKKANRRAPPRRKAPPPRRSPAASGVATALPEPDANGSVAVATTPGTVTATQMTGGATAQRRGPAPRRPQLATVSYEYLRHDLRLLGILAPSMLVIVVIAYFIFH